MMWKDMDMKYGDYRILQHAHTMLDDDDGLSDAQYDSLREFVYDQIGPTVEMVDLFAHVRATDGRWYVK